MGLETRGNRTYFYRKRRIGDRVVSEYVGAGETARLIAAFETVDRDKREMERYAQQAEAERFDALLDAQREYAELSIGLVAAALLLAGYRTHHGEWRKRRGNEDADERGCSEQ
jgi:hypothetical protein